jgi:hypothetical protein
VAEVRAAAQGLGALLDRLDPSVVTVDDAMAMVEVFCRIERMAAAGKTLLAKRATDSLRLLRHKGFKDGVDYLARTLDISAGDAAATLGMANALEGLDATTTAAKTGGLSPRKVAAVASAAIADPTTENAMLKLAETAPVKVVQERSRQIRRHASQETDEQRAANARRRRSVSHWIDPDTGDGRGSWRLPPGAHAEVVAELNRRANRYFERARRHGRRELPGAYMADALTELTHQPTARLAPPSTTPPPGTGCPGEHPDERDQNTGNAQAKPDKTRGDHSDSTDNTEGSESAGPVDDHDPASGDGDGLPLSRSRRNTKIHYRIDATAAQRGHTTPDERCEIAGVGPVPASEIHALTRSDAFKTVIATDPHDHTNIIAVTHLGHRPLNPHTLLDDLHTAVETRGVDVATLVHRGRHPTAAQTTAIEWLSGGHCQIHGCTSGTGRLEIDHIEPWAHTHHTELHQLALLCGHHHDLKTRHNWTIGPLHPNGTRHLTPPPPPEPPGDPPDTS